MKRLIPLLILLSMWHLAHEAKACSCGPTSSVYEEYHLAAAVFVGKAIASNDGDKSLVGW